MSDSYLCLIMHLKQYKGVLSHVSYSSFGEICQSPPPSLALSRWGTYGIYIFQCAKNNSKMDLECMHDTCTSLYVFIHHSFHTEVSYIKMPF